jgi:hypothetical protein
MNRTVIAALLATVLAACNPAPNAPTKSEAPTAPADGVNVNSRKAARDAFGCQDKETFEKITKLLSEGDKDLASKVLGDGIASGTCTLINKGDMTLVEDTSIFAGMVKLRRKGEESAYWTFIEVAAQPQ